MNMMKFFAVLLSISFVFPGCLKNDTSCPSPVLYIAPAAEQKMVADYLAANNLTASKDTSGMYYKIVQPGTGGSPNLCSSISITYSGKLSNGTQFDNSVNSVFTLGVLIEGWKRGLPLIQKGGRILLYIPPSLGYGYNDIKDSNGAVVIPGNSMLIFDVTLNNFQ